MLVQIKRMEIRGRPMRRGDHEKETVAVRMARPRRELQIRKALHARFCGLKTPANSSAIIFGL